jgi:hypothetical protein
MLNPHVVPFAQATPMKLACLHDYSVDNENQQALAGLLHQSL